MALLASLLALRGDARIQKVPPYLSAFCIFVGIAWLLVLPLNEYSRRTYVSENALLPGQVHTYFQGSEHNIFRAYRHEVHQLIDKPVAERSHRLEAIFKEQNLKFATQKYNYTVSNRTIANENVYAILQGPRADATEAIVLVGAWKNMKDEVNNSGVALILTLARYFKRWSLWSKDIIFLVPGDSTIGPQAWVDAYHDGHDTRYVEDLKIKSGALQGAIAVDYPAGPWGHRYDKLHVVYDGINGQLPNLDLFNTAVQVASNQMGISSAIHGMFDHKDTYQDRLETLFRGMLTQGLGHATGPHSSFIPYHVDAITLVTVGDGWHDEISLGKTVESLVRSLNNLLEHLHQSFFFYLLLQANRFVSIGTYLPSAMLIAFNFSITAIALWVKSGQSTEPAANPASTAPPKAVPQNTSSSTSDDKKDDSAPKDTPPVTLVTTGTSAAIVPTTLTQTVSRPLLRPTLILLMLHLISLIPLYMFNTHDAAHLIRLFFTALNMTTILPFFFAFLLTFTDNSLSAAETTLLQSLSLLLLGVFLAVLATLNFSLAVIIGLLCTPLSFVRKSENMGASTLQGAMLLGLNPLIVVKVGTWALGVDIEVVLKTAAVGWTVWGLWTQVIVWVVWWPAWVVASFVVASGAMD